MLIKYFNKTTAQKHYYYCNLKKKTKKKFLKKYNTVSVSDVYISIFLLFNVLSLFLGPADFNGGAT